MRDIIGVFPIKKEPENKKIGPGVLVEYGWYDAEVEKEIKSLMANNVNLTRIEAIIIVFNNI